ncbi:MAG TPA: hypothetical protein DIT40_00490 [Alphaproteobacteria bacterium]|nr:hypothetical protein [Alphaproteobacteria bacterium]
MQIAVIGVGAWLGACGHAWAQPTPLYPPATRTAPPPAQTAPYSPPAGPTYPQPATPAPAPAPVQTSPADTQSPADSTAASPDAIQIGELPAFDISTLGLLDAENGGFGTDLWARTERPLVETLIAQLPMQAASRSRNIIAARLLLSRSNPPAGERSDGHALLALRLERLAAGGWLDAVGQLVGKLAEPDKSPAILRSHADYLLVQNDLRTVCPIADQLVADSPDIFWLKLSAICKLDAGNLSAAQLAAELIAELDPTDTAFQSLFLQAAGGAPATLPDDFSPTLVQLLLIRRLGLPLTEAAVNAASPASLLALTRMRDLDPGLVIAAAERAEAIGALPTSELIKLYTAAPPLPEDPEAAKAITAPLRNAGLYQAVQAQQASRARALALSAAFDAAHESDTLGPVARSNLTAMASLQPGRELLWLSGNLTRGLLIAGDSRAALSWYQMVRLAASPANIEAQRMAQFLWPLMRLALSEAQMADDPTQLVRWLDLHLDRARPETRMQAELLMAAMDGLGLSVSEPALTRLALFPHADGNPRSDAETAGTRHTYSGFTLDRLLQIAAADNRVGGTLLIALNLPRADTPQDGEPAALAAMLQALRAVGLETEARQIAIELAIAAGL